MTEEYFEKHVLKCKVCGDIPILLSETSLFPKTGDKKYRVVCWSCKWDDGEYGSKTGLCKTPENALKIWNKKFGTKEENV